MRRAVAVAPDPADNHVPDEAAARLDHEDGGEDDTAFGNGSIRRKNGRACPERL
jgi:hypothetical protein